MKNTFEIARIIHDYLLGEISEEEQRLLDEWVRQSKRHREMLKDFQGREYWDRKERGHRVFGFEKGYRKFEARKKREMRRAGWMRVAMVAAMVCCVVSGSVFWLWRSERQGENEIARVEIPIVPGERRAVLVLDNGQRVDLFGGSELKVEEKSTVISIKDNHIVYSREDSLKIEAVNRVYTPRGGEYSLELSDGTSVWLNAESELSYPVRFKKDCREVEINGEAYFEVAKSVNRPFVVNANGMKIKVLGTSFNVRAYEDEERQTTLVEGCVEIAYGNQRVKINPGQQVVLKKRNLEVRQVDVDVYLGWKSGLFVFEDHLLGEVLRELERWYDVQIVIEDEKIEQLKFTSDFPRYENIGKVLDIIELATCVKFEVRGRTITVRMDE